MKIIGEIYKPDIVMLPVGGVYTMNIDQAMFAAEWLNSNIIIPIHYNTFDAIKIDIEIFKKKVCEINKTPIVLSIGECFEF